LSPLEDFGPSYLKDNVNRPGFVKFATNAWEKLTDDERSAIDLLNILKGKSLYLYDEIQKWKQQQGTADDQDGKTRSKRIEDLGDIYGYGALKPKIMEVELPHTKAPVNLVIFPFGQMLLSLLADPVAMQPKNLTVDADNPFKTVPSAMLDGFLDDFKSGEVYRTAVKLYCTEKNKDIMCEILLFVDKTHLDHKSKHTLEPIMFTIGLFNWKFHNNHSAWRPLGYVPSIDKAAPHASVEAKHRDYHLCIRVIVSELVEFQRLGGIEWSLYMAGGEESSMLLADTGELYHW
jgi:Plavaka transposase